MAERTQHDEVVQATEDAEANLRRQEVPINMYEAHDAIVIVAPLPAVMPEDVEITLRASRLHIAARVRSAGTRDYLVHEWDYGGYERDVVLPEGFGAGMEASLANGQLAVRVLRGEPLTSFAIMPERG
jgi:HSP20 family molecular chaperone IbpA